MRKVKAIRPRDCCSALGNPKLLLLLLLCVCVRASTRERSMTLSHTHTHTRARIEGLRTFSIIQLSQTDLTNGVCGHENLTRQNALDLDLDVHQPITDIF